MNPETGPSVSVALALFKFFLINFIHHLVKIIIIAGLVAHLDARPPTNQDVAGTTPAGSATFFRVDHEMFSSVILSHLLTRKEQLSVSGKRMCTILVNRLED